MVNTTTFHQHYWKLRIPCRYCRYQQDVDKSITDTIIVRPTEKIQFPCVDRVPTENIQFPCRFIHFLSVFLHTEIVTTAKPAVMG